MRRRMRRRISALFARLRHHRLPRSTVGGRFAAASEEAFEAARERLTSRAALTATTILIVVVVSVVGVLWYGATRVVAGELSGGVSGPVHPLCVVCGRRDGGAVGSLGGTQPSFWCGGEATGNSCDSSLRSGLLRRPSTLPVACTRGEIAFEDVSYSYPSRPDTSALDHLSFQVRAGERVAIVGASGAGKEHCVLGVVAVLRSDASGTVRIDGRVSMSGILDPVDVAALGLRWYRKISLYLQSSVAENIAYGAEGASARQPLRRRLARPKPTSLSSTPCRTAFDTKCRRTRP